MRWTPRRLQFVLNVYPPYLGAGVQVEHIAADYSQLRVAMQLRWFNRNFVGTHFGGSLYAMVDPHLMLLLIARLGPEYVVWDQAATIEFRRPGRGRVHCTIALEEHEVARIRAQAADGTAVRPTFDLRILDEGDEVVAGVHKVLYVRKR